MDSRGVALVEVLVSVAVIGAGLVSVIGALDTCVRTADHSRQRTTALFLLEESLNAAVASDRLRVGSPMTGRFDKPYDQFSWRWEKEALEVRPWTRVTVTIDWKRANRPMSLSGQRVAT